VGDIETWRSSRASRSAAGLLLLTLAAACTRDNPIYEGSEAATTSSGSSSGSGSTGAATTGGPTDSGSATDSGESSTGVGPEPACGDGMLAPRELCFEIQLIDLDGPAGSMPLAVADVDGDEIDDVIFARPNEGRTQVLAGSSAGLTPPMIDLGPGVHAPSVLVVSDLDGMGVPDYVLAGETNDGEVLLLRGATAPLTSEVTLGFPERYSGVALGRFDEGESLDVVVTLRGADKLIGFFDDGSMGPPDIDHPLCEGSSDVAAGNLRGDERLEVVVTCAGSNSVEVRYNVTVELPANNLATGMTYSDPGPATQPRAVALHDWNGDERLDVLVAREGTDEVAIYLNDGEGGLAAPVAHAVGPHPRDLAAADFDGDGRIDVVLAHPGEDMLSILRQSGTDEAPSVVLFPAMGGRPWAVATGDVNGDGAPDVIASMSDVPQLMVLLSNP